MGYSESDSSKCRHPNPKQLPGVCSSCLIDRLSKLSTNSPSSEANLVFSTSSSLSSTSTSSASTTAKIHRRNGSEAARVSVGMVLNSGLKKSRSVSCAPLVACRSGRDKNLGGDNKIIISNINNFNNNINEEEKCEGVNKMKKKEGFLKKLIHTTSKKTKGALTHSKTIKHKERSSQSQSQSQSQSHSHSHSHSHTINIANKS